MGSRRNVLTLTSILDSQFVGFWSSLVKYLRFNPNPVHIPQLRNRVSLSLLGFLSILASSLCLVHNIWFAGALYMMLGISYVTLGLTRHHSDRELPLFLLTEFFILLEVLVSFMTWSIHVSRSFTSYIL